MHTVTQSLTLQILIDEVDIQISMHCAYTVHIHTRQDTETMLDKMTNEYLMIYEEESEAYARVNELESMHAHT